MRRSVVAIVGARGFGKYGGFETFVAELSPRLEERGLRVYCSSEESFTASNVSHPEIVVVPFPFRAPSGYYSRHVYEFLFDQYFALYFSLKRDVTVVYFLGTVVNISAVLPRLFGKRSLVNMAGLEWKRMKFSPLQRRLIRLSLYLALLGTNTLVIDSRSLADYIPSRLRTKVEYVTYGVGDMDQVTWNEARLPETVQSIGPDSYWLLVARLQPDNNIHDVIHAYLKSSSTKPMIIVGDFACSEEYRRYILELSLANSLQKRVVLTGGIYDQMILNMLRQNSYGYIHPHSIGGTNPSLLEAMMSNNAIIAHDNEFNREVGHESILYYRDLDELKKRINFLETNPNARLSLKHAASSRALSHPTWDDVADSYLSLFHAQKNRL